MRKDGLHTDNEDEAARHGTLGGRHFASVGYRASATADGLDRRRSPTKRLHHVAVVVHRLHNHHSKFARYS